MNFKNIKTISLICLALTISKTNLNAQVFRGVSAFKELIEYEGQRFLMEDVYTIQSDGFDSLRIERTIQEIDSDEGFKFVLTSMSFDHIVM